MQIFDKRSRTFEAKKMYKLSIRTILIILFLLQVLVVAFFTTYLSFRISAKSIRVLVDESIQELNSRIQQQVSSYFTPPEEINEINANLISQKLLSDKDQESLIKHFRTQVKARNGVNSIYFANNNGGIANAGIDKEDRKPYIIYTDKFMSGLFYKYAINAQGEKTNLINQIPFFDARTRLWYHNAVENPGVVWSDVYVLVTGNDLGVTASKAVENAQNELLGVVGVDLFLSDISKFLSELEIGKSGQTFIMEKSGLLVASSGKDKLFNIDSTKKISTRINALDSESDLIRTVAKAIEDKTTEFANISVEMDLDVKAGGHLNLVHVTPFSAMPSHQWLIVTIIPRNDFMGKVYANNRITLFLILIALLLSVIVAFWFARVISKPIQRLDKKIRAISQGEWSLDPFPSRIREIDDLAFEIYNMKNTIQFTIENLNNEIKERELAEATLQESQKRLRKTQEIANMGSWELDMVTGQLSWSDEVFHICGVDPGDFEARYDAFVEMIHPEDREAVDKAYRDSVAEKKESYEIEHRIIRPSGEIRFLYEKCEHLKDSQGKISRSVGMVLDITERRQTEAILQEIIDNNPISIQIVDKEGYTIKVNDANVKLFGLAPPPEFSVFTDPQISGQGQGALLQRAKNGEVTHLPDMYYNVHDFNPEFPDKPIWVKVVIFPLFGKEGTPDRFVLMHEDVTHRKAAEKALISAKESAEESNRLKTSFLANMSHELRTPLSGILGFSELLARKVKDAESTDMVNMINQSGNRLLNTLNLILDLSRIEANKQDVIWSIFDLNALLQGVAKLFEPVAMQKGLQLTFKPGIPIAYIRSDTAMLEHIVNELIGNAIKYTDTGSVTITSKVDNTRQEPRISIEITDTGIGIPDEQQSAIFDAFRQVSEGWSRSYEGTGLGLTICKKYAGLLGGEILVDSKFGAGSRFTVSLPPMVSLDESFEDTHPWEDSISQEKANRITGEPLPKVLLVDDDEMCHLLTNHMLCSIASLDCVLTGEEGIFRMQACIYDAVLLDINLKRGMSGLDVLNQIKQMESYRNVPVIAITAYAMLGDKEIFLSQGFSEYVSKPFTGNKLSKMLLRLLKQR